MLSDYAKGVLSEQVCRSIIAEARRLHVPVLVDPKGGDFGRYRGATAICPNARRELAEVTGESVSDLDRLLAAGQALTAALGLDYMLVTLSDKGIAILRSDSRIHAAAAARQVYDVSGAGDTVVAVVAVALAAGVKIEHAVRLANVAAGIVIGKVGTVPIQRSELLGALSQELQPGSAERVLPLELLMARVAGWRSRALQVVFTNGCFDLLHLGHIALMEQARRMGDRLIVAVNSDASVRRLKGPNRPLVREQERARILAALAAVDAVVVFGENTPLRLIEAIRPDVLVKGGDYCERDVVGASEIRGWGGRVRARPAGSGMQHYQLDRAIVRRLRRWEMSMAPLLLSVRIPTLLTIFWRKHLARVPVLRKATTNPRSIVVFRLDQLGDLVLTTPLFRELKRMYPEARCTVVAQPAYRAILTTNHNIDEILPLYEVKAKWLPARARHLRSALWFYWKQLRHRQFDMAISPRWDVDEDLATMLCVLANVATRIGYSERASAAKRRINRGFDAAFDVVVPPGPLRHEVDRNLQIVEALSGQVEDRHLEICLTANDRKFAKELLTHHEGRRTIVAIGIGGRAASRRWPLNGYAELIALLNQHRGVQPVIVCAKEEEPEASELAELLPVRPYILSGVPLRAVCAVLERSDLFVGNDCGTAHLAAAMDCRTVVVSRHPLGGDANHSNSPARFAPRCTHYRVVQPVEGMGNCRSACHSTEPHCIKLVTAEMVLAAALDLLHPSLSGLIEHEVPHWRFAPAGIHTAEQESIPEAVGAL